MPKHRVLGFFLLGIKTLCFGLIKIKVQRFVFFSTTCSSFSWKPSLHLWLSSSTELTIYQMGLEKNVYIRLRLIIGHYMKVFRFDKTPSSLFRLLLDDHGNWQSKSKVSVSFKYLPMCFVSSFG
ncbi:hypothetical protein Dimus_008962 [Dionaea muscipula]